MFGGRRDRRNGDHVASSSLVFDDSAYLFTAAFSCQRLFDPLLLARLQVEGVFLNFLDDVFLLNLTFEPSQRVLDGFAILYSNFRHSLHPHSG
jgi:hypothetical protein